MRLIGGVLLILFGIVSFIITRLFDMDTLLTDILAFGFIGGGWYLIFPKR